ncbi:4501_t:CDS:2, partial [Ambispora gerdemannii]
MESRSQVNHNTKTVPLGNDQSHVILTESPLLQTEVSELEQDDEIDKNQIVEQGLIQEFHLHTKENDSSIEISNSGDKSGNMISEESMIVSFGNSAQHLSHLFKTAIKALTCLDQVTLKTAFSIEKDNQTNAEVSASSNARSALSPKDNILPENKICLGTSSVIPYIDYASSETSESSQSKNADNYIIQDSSLKTQVMVPNKNRLYQYAIEHGINPKEFSIITETEKNKWIM